jgi:hypothetical protein
VPLAVISATVGSWTAARALIDAVDASGSGNVTFGAAFDCNYEGSAGMITQDSIRQSGISIKTDMVIHGNDAICDARGKGQFFYLDIRTGVKFTLNSITLKNARAGTVSATIVVLDYQTLN